MISFVVPIYNSADAIKQSHAKIKAQLSKMPFDYEIIFRNDASRDDSKEVLEKIASRDKKTRVFSNKKNRGLGYTLRKLINDANGGIIVYSNVDLSFDISCLPKMVKLLDNGADIVLASKYMGEKKDSLPLGRLVASRTYYLINRIIFGTKIKDIGSGLLVAKKQTWKNLGLKSDNFGIHIEIIAKAKNKGLNIKEIGVKYAHNNHVGSFKVLKHGPKTLVDTFAVWLKIKGIK